MSSTAEQNQANQLPNAPHIRALDIDYFYVAVDSDNVSGGPVSPYFRTGDEAKDFLSSCEIEGAYCIRAGVFPRDMEEAKRHEAMLFGSEAHLSPTRQTSCAAQIAATVGGKL